MATALSSQTRLVIKISISPTTIPKVDQVSVCKCLPRGYQRQRIIFLAGFNTNSAGKIIDQPGYGNQYNSIV